MKAAVQWGLAALMGLTAGGSATAQEGQPTPDPVHLTIAVNEHTRFTEDDLEVRPNQPIALTVQNPTRDQYHNWVLIRGGEDMAERLVEAVNYQNPETDYLPEDKTGLIAYTRLLPPGGSEVVRFRAPSEPGEYYYLCTNPGHYTAGEQGELVVQGP